MTDEIGSFWIKLTRAKQHLADLNAMLAPYSVPRPYAVRKRFDAHHKVWEYTAHVEDPPDPLLPTVVGDFLFNVRSALDHAAVALAPNKRKGQASFPIITENIEKAGLDHAETEARLRWLRATQGMPPDAIAIIQAAQPYRAAFDAPDDPHDHVLALLSSFQNADKHRELTVVAQGLIPKQLFFTLPDGTRTVMGAPELPPGKLLADGAVVDRLPDEMDVEVVGTVPIAIARSHDGPHRPIPHYCELLIDFVGSRVLAPLEHFVA